MAFAKAASLCALVLRYLIFAFVVNTSRCQHKCEPLMIKKCKGLNYNETLFPNFENHRSQAQANEMIEQLAPLFNVKCSPDLNYFVCSYYAPLCTKLGKLIPPCRSLCESARSTCMRVVTKFGYDWPHQLSCHKFPLDDGSLCVGRNQSGNRSTTTTATTAPISIIRNDKFNCPKDQEVPFEQYTFMGHRRCAAPCKNIFFSEEEIRIARIWTGFWSTVCAASTIFTLLTFFIDMRRFRYPERPIIFLSGCYFMVSVAFIAGFLAGDDISCNKPVEEHLPRTLTQGTKNEGCTVIFIIIYFFYMAASIWWVVLTLTWFLAAGLKWGHEAIENNSQFFHLVAWVIPAVKTIAVLVLTEVDGDELTGVCFVGLSRESTLRGFVLGPLFVYFFIGTFFLLSGFVSLFRVRSVLKNDGDKREKIEKLMIRIGVFSILYMVPAVTVIGCLFYEQANRNRWRRSWFDAYQYRSTRCMDVRDASSCPRIVGDATPDFAVFLVKYLMFLIVGITSGFWVWSTKTLGSWRRLYTRLKTSKAETSA